MVKYKDPESSQQGPQGDQSKQQQQNSGQQNDQNGQQDGQQQGQQSGQKTQDSGQQEGQKGDKQKGKQDSKQETGNGTDGDQESKEDGEGSGKQDSKPETQDKEKGKGAEEGEEEEEGDEPGKHMGKYHEQSGIPRDGSKKEDKVDEPDTSAGENPFDKKSQSEDGKQKSVETMVGAGRGIPKHMDPDEAIDIYYEMIATPVEIRADSETKGMAFPAIPYGAKQFDPERDEPDMISGIRINEDGTHGLEAYTDIEDVNAPLVEKLVAHPDVCMIIDSSGSMRNGGGSTVITSSKGDKAWGDRCSYHYALKAAHGIRNSLRSKNILPYIRMNVMIFSSSTTSTGWHDYSEGASSRSAMTKPLFGGTYLDPDELEKQLGDRDPCVVVLISDGGIQNWDQDKQGIMETLSKHFVAFIRIGGETNASREMKAAGFAVEKVDSDGELENKIIDVTNQMYKDIEGMQALESDWMFPK
jgi:hypothetical protein